MDRYERILALHRSLKTARYPVPIKGLMEELACSRATLYRDIAFLRDALGAPIESEGEGSIRYDQKEAERFELPGLWLNSDELHALLAAHQMLDRAELDDPSETNPEHALQAAERRLQVEIQKALSIKEASHG